MTKNDDKSFRIVVDKRIVKAFDDIPETFSIKDLLNTAKIPLIEQKSMYDVLERMVRYGLIHKSRDKGNWYKDHDYRSRDGFKIWLVDYYEKAKESEKEKSKAD